MRCWKYNNKKLLISTILFLFSTFFLLQNVKAITFYQGSCYYFNKTTGEKVGSSGTNVGRDCVKKINDEFAFCSQWKIQFGIGSNYKKDDSWEKSSKKAIIAGYLIKLIDKDYNGEEMYELTAAALNTFASKYLNGNSSYNFYNQNKTIKKYYDQALKEYENVNLSKKLPKPTIKTSNSVLNYTTSYYISDKITLSNLEKKYGGGSENQITYTLTATSTKGVAQICSNATGTNCQNKITLTERSANYEFYVKATGVDSNSIITIAVNGANSSTYPTTIRYMYSSSTQKLLQINTTKVNRTIKQSIQLTIPDLTKHRIVGYKVDEEGELLNGATLEIYKDNPNIASNKLASNNGGTSNISYETGITEETNDDFFNHDYYLVETTAPNGYILSSSINKFYVKGTGGAGNVTTCYYNGGSDSSNSTIADDPKRCNFEDYVYKCKSSNGEFKELSENDNCDFEESEPEEEQEVPQQDAYEKICYSQSESKEVDETYCTEKANYTKVVKSNGNITVTQSNIKNNIKIKKTDITGNKEVEGAILKICTDTDYKASKENCPAAKTIDNIELSWTSSNQATEFSGIKKGTYYIIETLPARGYVIPKTSIIFSINELGEVKIGETVVEDNLIIIKNELNEMTISKQELTTKKELENATMSICRTYEDENKEIHILKDQYENECIEATLANGELATWISDGKPHKIEGLPAGTYYLVEKKAPEGYNTADPILFKMSEKGIITNFEEKEIAENKIIVFDEKIQEVKTGMLTFYIILGITIVGIIVGITSYLYMKKKK